MAYYDTTTQAQVLNNELSQTRKVLQRIADFFSKVGGTLALNSDMHKRVHLIEKLNAKSDEELAQMGLKRQDIVHYAFRGILYV